MGAGLRVAVTLEQCWHRVPGGTASSALESARALPDARRPRAGRRERPATATRRRRRGRRRSRCETLPLPRLALYESWHRAAAARRCERATGPVDVIHATGWRMPAAARRRWSSRCTTSRSSTTRRTSPATGSGSSTRALELARRDAALVLLPVGGHASTTASRHGFDADRLRLVPWGVDVDAVDDDEVARRPGALRDRPAVRAVGRHHRAAQEPADPARRLRRLDRPRRRARARRARRVGTRTSTHWLAPVRSRCASLGFVPDRRPRGRSTPARRCSATRACVRASACRCSRRWPRARRWSPRRARRRRRSPATRRCSSTRRTSTPRGRRSTRLLDDPDRAGARRRRASSRAAQPVHRGSAAADGRLCRRRAARRRHEPPSASA